VTATTPLPKLITFDGEARSGKGTIVQLVKDNLRDEQGHTVMLIDAGQVFRCLVVAATNRGINLNDPAAIDAFLGNDDSAESCVQFVKAVYHMEKVDRDALLYTNEVSVNSAKVGASPLSQAFKDELLKKWLRDAGTEGYDIVLLDGRALEVTGAMLESQGLCDFTAGFYFVCDPVVGAMRTLGLYAQQYDQLTQADKSAVDTLVDQIVERNRADRERSVQPIVPPIDAPRLLLPEVTAQQAFSGRYMAIIDTSALMTKEQMAQPVINLISSVLSN
jgi:cytidylate kinase